MAISSSSTSGHFPDLSEVRCSDGCTIDNDQKLTVSVVIPALNEAENLPHVLPMIPTFVSEVILEPIRKIGIEVEQRK